MPIPNYEHRTENVGAARASVIAALGIEPPAFMERAICAQTDPEMFYPEKGGSTREAKGLCLRCPVQAECLIYALDNDERFGIWGGKSERERRKIKRDLERRRDQRKRMRLVQSVSACQWFALCTNEATGTMSHPTLGQVPICDRCRAKVEALS